MTKMVQFTRPMSPYNVGEEKALPDGEAERAEKEGWGKIVPSVFDKQAIAEETKKRQRYMTRGKESPR
ncbi:MAG TPA: hypothetical protein VKR31_00810 [Rhizomicrobium sp.]|nr:hypothetical protein [Rhizomicrobium sp.]